MTAEDAVERAVAEARRLAPDWAGTSLRSRAALLGALARTVAGASDRIVETVRAETGKHEADVVLAEVVHATVHAGWLSRNVPRLLAPQRAPAWPLLH
jgi:acyl-CoA reductase-like NAD-dependent aldehyde dehydrogenase